MVNLIGGRWSSTDIETIGSSLSKLLEHTGEMPYCIIQTVESGMSFTKTQLIQDKLKNEQLLRLNMFGNGGDFHLRFDDGYYLWRFVGTALTVNHLNGKVYPEKLEKGADNQALLWGEFDDNRKRWYDNIVGSAQLTYPVDTVHMRMYIHAWSITNPDGQIVTFWTYKFSAYSPTDNAN